MSGHAKWLSMMIREGYKILPLPNGQCRIYIPSEKIKSRGREFYVIDPLDARHPCTCRHGSFGKRCRHLNMVDAWREITHKGVQG